MLREFRRAVIAGWNGIGPEGRMAREGIGTAMVLATGAVLGFGTSVILARQLGSTGYGDYALAMSVLLILLLPSQAGLPQPILRAVAAYRSQDRWQHVKGVLMRGDQAVLAASLTTVLVTGGAIALAGRFDDAPPLLYGLPLLPLMALDAMRGSALRGLGHVALGNAPNSVVRPAAFLIFLGAIGLVDGSRLTAQRVLLLHGGAALIAVVAGSLWLAKRLPSTARQLRPLFETKSLRSAALPFIGIGAVQVLNSQMDIIILGIFRPSADVGVYRVALAAGALTAFFLTSANLVLQPEVARLHAEGKMRTLQRLLATHVRLVSLATLPLIIGLTVLGRPILVAVYGTEYSPAYGPLVILILGQAVNVLAGPVAMILNMTGYESETVRGLFLAALVGAFSNLILVSRLGPIGTALAHSCALITWNLYLMNRIRSVLGLATHLQRGVR